jgi:hypothetical protein
MAMILASHEPPKLSSTRNYDLFEQHPMNREFREKVQLRESMLTHGFLPSCAITCMRLRGGKLLIVSGHHRFKYAKELGLPVWYIVDDTIPEAAVLQYLRERDGTTAWSVTDFVQSQINANNQDYVRFESWRKENGLSVTVASMILSGSVNYGGAYSSNDILKRGSFTMPATIPSLSAKVLDLIQFLRAEKWPYAAATTFVAALMLSCRVPEFDPSVFKARIRKHGIERLPHLNTTRGYLAAIQDVYNYMAKAKRLELLTYHAIELSKKHKASRSSDARRRSTGNSKGSK